VIANARHDPKQSIDQPIMLDDTQQPTLRLESGRRVVV
jgi:hypothetical protein